MHLLKNSLTVFLCIFIISSFAFAAGQEASGTVEEAEAPVTIDKVTYTEWDGTVVNLSKNPERVIVLLNSLLDLWYLSGGTAVARVKGSINVPEEAKDIVDLGSFSTPNVEQIFALEPDLVIFSGSSSSQIKVRELVEQNKIESVSVRYTNYADFMPILELFTDLTGRKDIFDAKIADIRQQVDSIVSKVPGGKKPKVFILFSSSKSVSAELPVGGTGTLVEMMGAENIVSTSPVENATRIDFSLEQKVVRDPDIVLIKTMGNIEKAKERIKKDVSDNDAWAGLRAVKEGRVYYLPKDLFMYKPNARFPEAFEYLGKIFYPGVFGELE
jgi:iron complex transport system substrate-binding protein